MPKIAMVDLQTQYQKIKPEIDAALEKVLQSCQFINGQAVKDFSKHLAEYLGVQYAIPCANGTDALQIALMALDLEPGDEVITTPFTFVATAEVIALLGLKPVFVDINPCTFVINEYLIKQAITERTRAIIPVHLFGQAANMEAIMKIAKMNDIAVIEDNAQAIGADFIFSDASKAKLGTIGHIGCTSFFPSKNLGCYGDGGALFTNDEKLAQKIQLIANHGSAQRYHHTAIGVNSRLDSMQAAVLNTKLKYLDQYNQARQKAAKFYTAHLSGIAQLTTPKEARYSTHIFHQYTLLVEQNRDGLATHLKSVGIPTGIYYPIPLHLQAAYENEQYKTGDFPVAEEMASKVLSLPMHTELTEDIQYFIIQHIKDYVS